MTWLGALAGFLGLDVNGASWGGKLFLHPRAPQKPHNVGNWERLCGPPGTGCLCLWHFQSFGSEFWVWSSTACFLLYFLAVCVIQRSLSSNLAWFPILLHSLSLASNLLLTQQKGALLCLSWMSLDAIWLAMSRKSLSGCIWNPAPVLLSPQELGHDPSTSAYSACQVMTC